ncbi:MAG TPA: TIGR03619 family F420-dependent LLM class oxidoreductase [Rhodopila sp.]|uniref:TIGR03619 family F420-dependent LLM class oxidoreductase n=1 Tax=Rhodopila sp. TaxID=2480087 RepID=UPI002CBD3967|nr:TIGR03619 family F420-dependent LLM class oxidoreductase [Rhodopila sp.]HVY17636.1 TIGR03619 family F420-dependent LLM class oxidoreductase [Rhodopila sp.]
MQIGCSAPTSGPLIDPDSLLKIATEAESLGFDYVTVSDHLIIPTSIASRYPYSESGEFPSGAAAPRLEQLTAATFIAAATTKLGIVTSVMVVPHRPAVLTAKILATIDYLSKGRLTLGIGAGWCEEEFNAIGTEPFAERGAVTDEYMAACRELWTADHPKFDGKYVKFQDVLFPPKPPGRIPIWVGGESGPALRRTARYGDAWYPIGTNPQFPMDTLTRYKAGVAKLRGMTEKAGRSPSSVGLAYRVSSNPEAQPKGTVDGERKLFTGSAVDYAGDIQALAEVGVTAFDFGLFGADLAATIDNMRRFRDNVIAKVR